MAGDAPGNASRRGDGIEIAGVGEDNLLVVNGGEAQQPGFVAIVVFSLGVGLPAPPSAAHPGGLNAEGCHNNRKTGGYHCHRGASASPAKALRAVSSSSEREFANCSQARAAGAAPVRTGDPGYGRHLDRDGDGVGCE